MKASSLGSFDKVQPWSVLAVSKQRIKTLLSFYSEAQQKIMSVDRSVLKLSLKVSRSSDERTTRLDCGGLFADCSITAVSSVRVWFFILQKERLNATCPWSPMFLQRCESHCLICHNDWKWQALKATQSIDGRHLTPRRTWVSLQGQTEGFSEFACVSLWVFSEYSYFLVHWCVCDSELCVCVSFDELDLSKVYSLPYSMCTSTRTTPFECKAGQENEWMGIHCTHCSFFSSGKTLCGRLIFK